MREIIPVIPKPLLIPLKQLLHLGFLRQVLVFLAVPQRREYGDVVELGLLVVGGAVGGVRFDVALVLF